MLYAALLRCISTYVFTPSKELWYFFFILNNCWEFLASNGASLQSIYYTFSKRQFMALFVALIEKSNWHLGNKIPYIQNIWIKYDNKARKESFSLHLKQNNFQTFFYFLIWKLSFQNRFKNITNNFQVLRKYTHKSHKTVALNSDIIVNSKDLLNITF